MLSKKPTTPLVNSKLMVNSNLSSLFMLSLFSFTIFIIYKYIKSLEKEVKDLNTKLETLSTTLLASNFMDQFSDNKVNPSCTSPLGCPFNKSDEHPVENLVDLPKELKEDEDDEDEDEIKSEDVVELISDLNSDEYEIKEEKEEVQEKEEKKEEVQEKEQEEEEEEFELKKKNKEEDELLKKTNDELKKMLKDLDKSVKGTKTELVKRLLE